MSLNLITRFVVDAGYLVLFVGAIWGAIYFRDPARKMQAVGWSIVAAGWLLFYLVINDTSLSDLPEIVRTPALWSRVLHFPVIGLGISTLVIAHDRERDLRQMWADIDNEIRRGND